MNKLRISLTAALLSLCLLLGGCGMEPGGTAVSFSMEDIPAYAGEPMWSSMTTSRISRPLT